MKDKELTLQEIESSNTLGGARCTEKVMSRGKGSGEGAHATSLSDKLYSQLRVRYHNKSYCSK
jgi:hypothetical protein